MTPPAPARVFGYVAAEADVCVLLRRGPSKWVLMVRWNLATDEFEIGQWLKARVYEDQCDLSPDGQLFVYQANDGQYSTKEFGGVYSAVSRPPFFTALAFWAQYSTHSTGFGWTTYPFGNADAPTKGMLPDKYRRRLRKRTSRSSCNKEANSDLEHQGSDRSPKFGRLQHAWDLLHYNAGPREPKAQWIDADRRGRLLFAHEGRIYVRDADGECELIDLNPYEFRPLEAPEWAKQWP